MTISTAATATTRATGGFGHDVLAAAPATTSWMGDEAPDRLSAATATTRFRRQRRRRHLRRQRQRPDPLRTGPDTDRCRARRRHHLPQQRSAERDQQLDCGDGNDTVYNTPGAEGRANRKLLARPPNCETRVDEAAQRDPTRGISCPATAPRTATTATTSSTANTANKLYGNGGDDVLWGDAAHDAGAAGPPAEGLHQRRLRRRHDLRRSRHQHRDGRRRQRLPAGQRRLEPDLRRQRQRQIRLAGKRTVIDAGAGDDLIVAITSSGSGSVKCGAGKDTVTVSRFKGNARRVKVAKDCERKIKARLGKGPGAAPAEPGRAHRRQPGGDGAQPPDRRGGQRQADARVASGQQAERERTTSAAITAPAPATSARGTSSLGAAPISRSTRSGAIPRRRGRRAAPRQRAAPRLRTAAASAASSASACSRRGSAPIE